MHEPEAGGWRVVLKQHLAALLSFGASLPLSVSTFPLFIRYDPISLLQAILIAAMDTARNRWKQVLLPQALVELLQALVAKVA